MVIAPAARRRLVGKALRRQREILAFKLDDAARMLGCDRSKVSRIETGERGISLLDLKMLLDCYGVTGERRDILTELADPRGAFGWYREYGDVLPGGAWDCAVLETAATRIEVYEAQRVPLLLQTPEYARALAAACVPLAAEAAWDREMESVAARQQAILGERHPGIYPGERRPVVHLIIGEAALLQEVGSERVMGDQLRALARAAEKGGAVTLQVLPFDSGAHSGAADGSVEILRFDPAAGLSLVHIGGIGGGASLDGDDVLTAYANAFDQLRAFALTSAQSADLLDTLARS
jgi:transcriptional regulator with XRE-family HTH domain